MIDKLTELVDKCASTRGAPAAAELFQHIAQLLSEDDALKGGGSDVDETIRAVFIDDDVRELMRPDVVQLPLLRVLFRRTGL